LDEPPSFSILTILSEHSVLYIFFTALLLFISAWASAVESAFFSLSPDDVERFKGSNDDREKIAAALFLDPRLLLNVLTTCKYAMLLAAAIPGIAFFFQQGVTRFDDISLGTAVLFLTVAFALAGVIVPKIYGTTFAITLARRNSKACRRLIRILKPILQPLLRMSIRVEKKLDESTEQKSVEELTQALQLATVDNDPVEGEKEILDGIVNFGTLTVKQVMRPRSEIFFTDVSLDFFELMDFIKRSGYSRVPVCRGSLDMVEGFLYIKDLLPFLQEGKQFAWQKLIRPGYFVQDSKKIDFLLKDFQEKRVHLALVINQQGSTAGLITLEDIIEEILGDINDEFDEVGVRYHKMNESTFLFDGKTSIYEFCRVLHIDPREFYPVKGINESLGTLILEVNEKLPAVGDKIVIPPFTFVIESVDQKRIKKIRVQINEEARH
jgi:gliding motility-associated protein GldE